MQSVNCKYWQNESKIDSSILKIIFLFRPFIRVLQSFIYSYNFLNAFSSELNLNSICLPAESDQASASPAQGDQARAGGAGQVGKLVLSLNTAYQYIITKLNHFFPMFA